MTQDFIFDQTTSITAHDTLPGLTTALDALPSLGATTTDVDAPSIHELAEDAPDPTSRGAFGGITQALQFAPDPSPRSAARRGRRLRRATGSVDLKAETVALVALAKEQLGRDKRATEDVPSAPHRRKRKIAGFRKARSSSGVTSGPYASPQNTHRTMIQALKGKNLEVFLKCFDPPLLRKMLGGFSPTTEAGRIRGNKVMRALRRKFEMYGYPTLGEELSYQKTERVFAYADPSNAQNRRCTYVRRHGRWVNAD